METIDPAFVCRRCSRRLSNRTETLRCPDCDETIPVVDDIPRFPVPDAESSTGSTFDWLAPIYETPLWFRPLYRFVGGPTAPVDDRSTVAELLDPDGRSVLDVACGTGRFTRAIDAASVTGIDVSDGMLERARRYGAGDARFARMSADRLWFDDGSFDRVACCWALHLLPDVEAALEEMRRVLRSDGSIAGTVLVGEYVLEATPVRLVARRTIGAEAFDLEGFRDRLRRAGFGAVTFDRRGAALFFRADAE
ncbi:class I SAM-dependent methyltransferase [Halopiger djelfimassiliensis]|uniref:class I SAM-dependent methyltransferase n=1 Tax=Halopiger djelfimassiliensis TaxID=1293047 RepID=UPI000677ADDA|nr:class I SAM-dependent methyltransferase [Halopiger djelfimassiliensis]